MSDTNWARSSFWRDGDACIEVRRDGDMVLVRDGDLGDDSREMVWSPGGWRDLIDALVNGEDSLWVIPANDRGGVHFGVGDSLHFEEGAWNSFVAGVKAGEFDVDRLSTPPVPVSEGSQVSGSVGPVAGGPQSNHAATGAGNGGVVPVPVAAQPRYVLDAPAILELVERYGDTRASAAVAGRYDYETSVSYRANAADLLDAIRGALTPVPDVEPGLRWGSGPLVDHNLETPQRVRTDPEFCRRCGHACNHTPRHALVETADGPVCEDVDWCTQLRHADEALAAGTGSADPDGGQ